MTKLTRRGILAAGVGGILGGKDAAKSVMEIPMSIPSQAGQQEWGVEIARGSDSAIGIKRNAHIAYLQKIASGQLHQWQEDNLNNYDTLKRKKLLYEVDGLKSMSNGAKLIMIDRLEKEKMRKDWIDGAKKQLAEMAKQSIFGNGAMNKVRG